MYFMSYDIHTWLCQIYCLIIWSYVDNKVLINNNNMTYDKWLYEN